MLIKQGLRLVSSGSVTQANMKLATINSGSMIDIGVDWSAYAGDDAGNTPHMLILYDSAGNRMQGFIGASGGGETLGVELITNGDCASDEPPGTDWTRSNFTISGGKAISNVQYANLRQVYAASSGMIIKSSINILTISTTSALVWFDSEQIIYISFPNAVGVTIGYRTFVGTSLVRYQTNSSSLWEINGMSLKRVTDISTNGLHLHSTRGGTNRNVASIDSGFDLNCAAGYDFKIYRCP